MTDKKIKELANAGWRFCKKPRKGNLYVSCRLGKDENSPGRHSDEYWAMIQNVEKGLTSKPESIKIYADIMKDPT